MDADQRNIRKDQSPTRSRPLQFRVGTMMLFVLVVAAAFGISNWLDLGLALPLFVVGFGALLAFMAGLMVNSESDMAVAYKTEAMDEAVLIRDYLGESNISALVREGHMPGFTGMNMHLHEVIVPSHQLGQAERLIEEKLRS